MKKMNLVMLALLANVGAANAQTLNCAALSNSAEAEPAGYAEQCLNVTPSPRVSAAPNAPTDTAFTIDVRGQAPRLPNSLYSFTLNAFQTQTLRGVTNPQIFAMDFNVANTTLFGITGSAAAPNPSTLGTIDQTTGAFTVVAPITGLTAGDNTTGLTINPVTGAALLSAVGGTPALSRLYTLNLTTGAATLVGVITAPTDPTGTTMIDISMNCQGALYAHNIIDDSLYSVNVATGAGTKFPTHGLAANFAQGMDFDNQSGALYAFIYTGAGTNRFGTFDLTTGAFTSLVTDNPLGEFEGAIPTACPAVGAPTITPVTPAGAVSFTLPATRSFVFNNAAAATASGTVSCTIAGAGFSVNPATVQTIPIGGSSTFVVSATAAGTGTLTCTIQGVAQPVVYNLTAGAPVVLIPTPTLSLWSALALLMGLGLFGALTVRRFS